MGRFMYHGRNSFYSVNSSGFSILEVLVAASIGGMVFTVLAKFISATFIQYQYVQGSVLINDAMKMLHNNLNGMDWGQVNPHTHHEVNNYHYGFTMGCGSLEFDRPILVNDWAGGAFTKTSLGSVDWIKVDRRNPEVKTIERHHSQIIVESDAEIKKKKHLPVFPVSINLSQSSPIYWSGNFGSTLIDVTIEWKFRRAPGTADKTKTYASFTAQVDSSRKIVGCTKKKNLSELCQSMGLQYKDNYESLPADQANSMQKSSVKGWEYCH